MVVAPDGSVSGSVSGGCVEGAVYELANDVVREGVPQLQRYGITDDDAFSVGLTCGGIVDVFVEPVSHATFPELRAVADDIAAHRPVAVATVIAHPDPDRVGHRLIVGTGSAQGTLGSERADAAVTDDALGLLAAGSSEVLTYGPDGQRRGAGMEVFVAGYAPRPRMLIFGAIDFAAALARQGSLLGYRVTVCDARPVFATRARFPTADEVVAEWPNRYLAAQHDAGEIDGRTVICLLTHDPKFDVPLLEVALRLPDVGYIGAMGSRRTHDDRMGRLRDSRSDGGRAQPVGQPDRPRPRGKDPGGDGGVDRRGDHRDAVGRRRPSAGRGRRSHPPRGRTVAGVECCEPVVSTVARTPWPCVAACTTR